MMNNRMRKALYFLLLICLCSFSVWGCGFKKVENSAEQSVENDAASPEKETAKTIEILSEAEEKEESDQTEKGAAGKEDAGGQDENGAEADPQTAQEELSGQAADAEAVTEQEQPQTQKDVSNGHVVAIDPGHQGSWVDMSAPEPIGPGASETKPKCTTGTSGSYSGVAEYELNLQIGLMLRDELKRRGYEVVMTREDNDTAISNSERALLATEKGAEVSVRIHANGSDDPGTAGALGMTMSPDNPYVGYLFENSLKLAQSIMDCYCKETGFTSLGVQYYDNMTGFNWSQVPCMIIEMGFMTNEHDDLAMQDPSMQEKMVKGIADGVDGYFGIDPNASSAVSSESAEAVTESDENGKKESSSAVSEEGPIPGIREQFLSYRESLGEHWAVVCHPLDGDKVYAYCPDDVHLTASVLKVFIMGAVYDRICYPDPEESGIYFEESYDGELRALLESMITVSDNNAANRLTEVLGQGDARAGMAVVNDFCQAHGYTHTSMGRLFLEENPSGDNYTSAGDCAQILTDIYNGDLVNAEASEKMLTILKGQTVTYKIPSGLPQGYSSANKTGEMPEGYGLGCIENDMAIVFGPASDYVLVVLSDELGGRNQEAQDVIRQISSYTASWMESAGAQAPAGTAEGAAAEDGSAAGASEGAAAEDGSAAGTAEGTASETGAQVNGQAAYGAAENPANDPEGEALPGDGQGPGSEAPGNAENSDPSGADVAIA